MSAPQRLHLAGQLHWTARLGLACTILVLMGGYLWAAGQHLREHYRNRDGDPALSMTDLKGAYHGVEATSPFLLALRRNHPPELGESDRTMLINWLGSDRISEDYDSLDLGELAPAEIISANCLPCHAGAAENGAGLRLEFWTDIERVAFSKSINPVNESIMIASLHAHAPTMAVIVIAVVVLAGLSRFPLWLTGVLSLLAGGALLADLGSWIPARSNAAFVPVIAVAGITHTISMGLLMVLVLIDLLLPGRCGCCDTHSGPG
ncbi:MAG: hypothetical protein ACR2GY_00150 [Phycisphaerales bacterium]